MIFTVEIKDASKDDAEIEMYLDNNAIDLLIKRLELLKQSKSHTHFATPAWAGNELTSEVIGSTNKLVNQLRLTFVPQ
jgi:hypothetical protein